MRAALILGILALVIGFLRPFPSRAGGADPTAGVRAFEIPHLGVTVGLRNSTEGKPIASITDTRYSGKYDYTELVNDINTQIANHVDAHPFRPVRWKAVPRKQIILSSRDVGLTLAIQGELEGDRKGRAVTTIYMPIEYYVERTRAGKTVFFFADGGDVRDERDMLFNEVNASLLFRRDSDEKMDGGVPSL
jgi:hypothetical protein